MTPTATVEPTATPIATSEESSGVGGVFTATRYGDGRQRADGSFEPNYNGLGLGCGASPATYIGVSGEPYHTDGKYHSDDPLILAAPPSRYAEWPCGTVLRITAPSGAFLDVVRTDSCPGCGANHVDLSEKGIAVLCGGPCDRITGLRIEVIR